jgi:predicted PurR-regulated permease PerM
MYPGMERYFGSASAAGRRIARLLALLVALAVICLVAYALRAVLTPVAVALAIAYILNPLVTWAERRAGWPRLLTVLMAFLGTGLLLLVGGVYLATLVVAQVQQLADNVPAYIEALQRWVQSSRNESGTTLPAASMALPTWDVVLGFLREHGVSMARGAAGNLATVLASVYTVVSLVVLIPVFLFFFLWRFNDIVRTVRDHLPATQRELIVSVVRTIDLAVANFFRGRLLVCMVVALATGVGWSLVGVPYSLPLGLLAGLLNLVPFLSLLAVPPALFCAFLGATEAGRPWALPVVLTMAVYLGVQALESFVLSPAIESRTSGLHPLTVVLALLIGGHLAGLLGLLLAVPVASTLKALAARFVLPVLRQGAGPVPGQCQPGAGGSSKPGG